MSDNNSASFIDRYKYVIIFVIAVIVVAILLIIFLRPKKCIPNCNEKVCGDDGCNGSCGTCSGNTYCLENKCVLPVIFIGGTDSTNPIVYSNNLGNSWMSSTQPANMTSCQILRYNGIIYLAVTRATSTLFTSPDCINNWTPVTGLEKVSIQCTALEWSDEIKTWLCGGSSSSGGWLASSTDGKAWTVVQNFNYQVSRIIWTGQWVIGLQSGMLYYDGNKWGSSQIENQDFSYNVTSLCSNGSILLAGCLKNSATDDGVLFSSSDKGKNWVKINTPSFGNLPVTWFLLIKYSKVTSRWVAYCMIGSFDSFTNTYKILYSDNPSIDNGWSESDDQPFTSCTDIKYVGNLWVACGYGIYSGNPIICTSSDGNSWTQTSTIEGTFHTPLTITSNLI